MGNSLSRIMWYVFVTTRGGPTRIKILELLLNRPYNMHQISRELDLDYKTVQHHMKMLEENKIIVTDEKRYGGIFFPSGMFEEVKDIFNEIKNKVR